MSEFQRMLKHYIGNAFDRERDFLKHFIPYNVDELVSVYMASERTSVCLLLPSGQHASTTIQTVDFIDWVDGLIK